MPFDSEDARDLAYPPPRMFPGEEEEEAIATVNRLGPKGDEMTKPVELVCPVCGRVVPHGACACVGDGLSAHGATIPRPRQ